ncbi:phage tail sheath C-terminal domain-containing protein [Anaerovorax odorimutans]|uniref:phage tail sheath C-terminal domain-containing protein n=1 Tax=Anaerovorax odorimutans TaxID=109327 RepID=UPI0004074571|nr:phage tail sheath C-terminal domain-containing protein [Anaerovorax odorimutans]
MANIGLPNISVVFTGLGVSAIQRGERGVACIVIKDDTDTSFTFAEYTGSDNLTSQETAKYTAKNVSYIKDCLLGGVSKVIVARMGTTGVLTDLLSLIKNKNFDWIGIAEGTEVDHSELASFIKSNSNKKYKGVVYKNNADDAHIVNFTNDKVTYTDDRGEVTGEKYIPRLVGALAGLPLTRSAISYTFTDLLNVAEPADLEASVNNGEFVLSNDENGVKVVRGINSLTTTGEGITDDFKYILIIETQDLIYKDIVSTWANNYKGKYKNSSDNQYLLIGAINSYFKELEKEGLLDDDYDNNAYIDVEAQRLANIVIYGEDEVSSWDSDKVISMTVGTQVFLGSNIKILNAMEDFSIAITI